LSSGGWKTRSEGGIGLGRKWGCVPFASCAATASRGPSRERLCVLNDLSRPFEHSAVAHGSSWRPRRCDAGGLYCARTGEPWRIRRVVRHERKGESSREEGGFDRFRVQLSEYSRQSLRALVDSACVVEGGIGTAVYAKKWMLGRKRVVAQHLRIGMCSREEYNNRPGRVGSRKSTKAAINEGVRTVVARSSPRERSRSG
jgi:hypothetical protein